METYVWTEDGMVGIGNSGDYYLKEDVDRKIAELEEEVAKWENEYIEMQERLDC